MILKRLAIAMAACMISVCAAAQGVISVDSKTAVLPDDNVELILTVNLAPQWYMYSTAPVKGGPMATALTAQESPDYSPVGGLEDVETPHEKFDQGFGMNVDYFEGTARFRQIIKPLTEEPFTFKGWMEFQTCNGLETRRRYPSPSIRQPPRWKRALLRQQPRIRTGLTVAAASGASCS